MGEPPDCCCVVVTVASRAERAAVTLSELAVVQGDNS